jgi:hypothetical protein
MSCRVDVAKTKWPQRRRQTRNFAEGEVHGWCWRGIMRDRIVLLKQVWIVKRGQVRPQRLG